MSNPVATRLATGAAVLGCAFALQTAAAADCAALYRERLAADLSLPYDAFDQTEGRGFRILARAGCPAEAADLIEAYVAKTGATERSLTWHVAQTRAEAGETAAAIAAARRVLVEATEARSMPFKWNDYVLAVIAFLQKDRGAFDRHRQVLADAAGHAGNALNLKLLDRLGANFGASYQKALMATP